MSSQINQLVKMANQIALNFGEHRDPEAACRKTAGHLQKFWTRGMREQLSSHIEAGSENVSPVVLCALTGDPGNLEPSS